MKSQGLDQITIWNKFRGGDDHILSLIYSEHAASLYRYGLKFTSNQNIIEDVIHDLFFDLMKNRRSIGETDNIHFYLLKSFRRQLIRQLKKEMRYGDDQVPEFVYGIRASVEYDLISEETKSDYATRIANAIEKLSPRQKEAIYLKFKKELDYSEISQLMGMGVEASRNLIYRAIKSLKDAVMSNPASSLLLFILKKIKVPEKKLVFRDDISRLTAF